MTRLERKEKYIKARAQHLAEHAWCEACSLRPALQVHHKRGRTGALLWDKDNFLAVCPICHGEITRRPAWAVDMGYSLPRLTDQAHKEDRQFGPLPKQA